jgi:tocopherol cyclase
MKNKKNDLKSNKIIKIVRKRSHPEAFQGNLKKKFYYEGWYNKIVDKKGKIIYAIIPTLAINKKTNSSHAFIQILDGNTGDTDYIKYDLHQFENLAKYDYDIRIDNNFFSSKGFTLNINQNKTNIKGVIEYNRPVPWPKTFFQPGVMGIMSYLPFLETYHGIISMNHSIKGSIDFNGKIVNFDGGKGYLEKDWGKSFPRAYIWAQTNHFSNPELSFILSIAKVPLINIEINGFLCVIWYKGTFYKFTTYTNAKIRLFEINSDRIKINIEDRKFSLFIVISMKNIRFSKLKAPHSGIMSKNIIETMNSNIRIKLYDKRNKIIILDDTGLNAGLDLSNTELLF